MALKLFPALENSRLIEQKIEIEAEHNRKTQELEEQASLVLSMLSRAIRY